MVITERQSPKATFSNKNAKPNALNSEQRTSGIDFLDYRNPSLQVQAARNRFGYGKVYLNSPTYSFLAEAQRLGLIDAYFEKNLHITDPERNLQIAWFFVNTDATSQEIGSMFGLTAKDSANVTFRKLIKKVYETSGEELKQRFPPETISPKRERSQRHFDKISASKNGKRDQIRKLAEAGESDYKKIAEAVGANPDTVVNTLSTLRRQRVLNSTVVENAKKTMKRIETAKTNADFEAILKGVPESRLKEDPAFISLRDFLKKHGFVAGNKQIQALRKRLFFEEVPYRTVDYPNRKRKDGTVVKGHGTFILVKQEDQILRIIYHSKSFVEKLGGSMDMKKEIVIFQRQRAISQTRYH